jgi:two-component system, NtrC family, sensor kinase
VENRPHTPNKTPTQRLSIHLDPAISADFSGEGSFFDSFELTSAHEAQFALHKKDDRLWVHFPDGDLCDFPYYRKNVKQLLQSFLYSQKKPALQSDPFESFMRTNQLVEKRVFSNVSFKPGENVKDLWDEIIKKINSISAESHSLNNLVERILDVPFLQNFQSSLIVLHIKGQTKAEILGSMWRNERVQSFIGIKEFNQFYNSVKKSKIKTFSTDAFEKVNLPFNGNFLAKEAISKKYSLISIVSRHDFLPYDQEEIELFETCLDLLEPHFERLIDQEFSDKRISELRICLKDFPLPLRIKDNISGASFLNDLYHAELQDQDIFFNKKVEGPFSLDLYDSDELRHYAFDLFHFQRISLLGELLNTLRHELSNPLFGLKLSSQIFTTFEVNEDSKDLMREIEKNINRCQMIIENFSNLYQIQTETRPVNLKKMIDESLVLSKSEGRSLNKQIIYQPGTEELYLNVPLIFVVQILFNLIVNSAQAVRQATSAGELQLNISADDKEVYVDILDNGPGISEERLCLLFKPFQTTKIQGTGLGLVLSRNLAQKMGGNLEYLADNQRQGAHFRLTLPR